MQDKVAYEAQKEKIKESICETLRHHFGKNLEDAEKTSFTKHVQ